MKKILMEYKDEVRELLNSKKYLFSIIIVAILSYGYLITHTTVGMDDTCLDRYYGAFFSENMIAAGRWGSYLLYKILNIASFTPFWLETLTTLVIIATAVLISCFIRKNLKQSNIVISLIFSCIYISYSLYNEPLIFGPSNLALFLANLLAITCVIFLYEMIHGNIQRKYFFLLFPVLTFSVSMYEACCQTFLIMLLACMISEIIISKGKNKDIFSFFWSGIGILVTSIILHYLILNVFYWIGVPTSDLGAERGINWFQYGLINGLGVVANNIWYYTVENVRYFPVLEFVIVAIIGLILSIYFSIKTKNVYLFNLYIVMLFSNLALSILQCDAVMYRACVSWGLFVAIIITTTYAILTKYKILSKIALILITFIILWQTKDMNQWFYSEYLKYQKDLKDAYQIANDIEKEVNNLNKPIVFSGLPTKEFHMKGQDGAQSNGLSVLWWGVRAFDDNSYELTKFINSLGYHFKKPTDEQYKKGKLLSNQMASYPKEGYIKEFEDIIVVNFK